ncbi:hypothetical protein NDU88_006005 [Pleurodeles waltl]|uniref:Uncharacterized protein n=1 Tax=Pleurodeles waltl TaxID=8319 RepID=A0AAV7L2G7_PLEWA|nr:hypothetical protein NDU88_006005 [Pleurodeles waltl]
MLQRELILHDRSARKSPGAVSFCINRFRSSAICELSLRKPSLEVPSAAQGLQSTLGEETGKGGQKNPSPEEGGGNTAPCKGGGAPRLGGRKQEAGAEALDSFWLLDTGIRRYPDEQRSPLKPPGIWARTQHTAPTPASDLL